MSDAPLKRYDMTTSNGVQVTPVENTQGFWVFASDADARIAELEAACEVLGRQVWAWEHAAETVPAATIGSFAINRSLIDAHHLAAKYVKEPK